ncbi:disulfide bond formation protein B [Faunimonas pinastri]|uniref:disulfide bond formation protein B n=1 Tax=Faunimonas pinastri TaxID=1855383 RepID=UPI000B872912|nr:disulfide bond formation protein B [Faunimonas pinastri]
MTVEGWWGKRESLRVASLIFVVAAAAILGALGFQYLGGYEPCHLCLMQRTPFYLEVPVALVAIVAAWKRAPRWVLAPLFIVLAILALYNTGLAIFHSGVEWKFWPGPASCSPSTSVKSAASVLGSLQAGIHGPSCEDAVWRFAGLSFAGWNVLISAFLALLGIFGATRAAKGV